VGFITIDGKEIVRPQYERIYKFGKYQKDWALVEQGGFVGFITNDGKEIVRPQYDRIIKNGDKIYGIMNGVKVEIMH